jgi:hypothetical protein
MATPPRIPSKKVFNPQLADLLALVKKDTMMSLNCHAIATVQSVNTADQLLTATINYDKTYFNDDGSSYLVKYPILIDCPFIILGGGGATLTFPITKGDECLILFNDRDIDNWFSGATSGPVASARLHSLSDGIALIGLQPTVANYDSTRAVLQNGTTGVGVSATKVKIYNMTTTLNITLQLIMVQLEALATATGNAGISASLTTLALQLGGLIE